MRVIVLGITGLLGNAMFRLLSNVAGLRVLGTLRDPGARQFFTENLHPDIIPEISLEKEEPLIRLITRERPDVVINCVGLVKQLLATHNPLQAMWMNALLPHRLAEMCDAVGARLVHFSTDCVFSGSRGNYLETDIPDGMDIYSRSKFLGEVDYPHAITLRTSFIGHELANKHGLISWFLAQKGPVEGYTQAIFSGLTSLEISRVVRNHVLPRSNLRGLYHLAAQPIDKYRLLKMVAAAYAKDIEILPSEKLVINRSLDATRFYEATGYVAPEWSAMIQLMHAFR